MGVGEDLNIKMKVSCQFLSRISEGERRKDDEGDGEARE